MQENFTEFECNRIFQTRLQFFGLAVKGYTNKLQEFISNIPKSDLSKEENQVINLKRYFSDIDFLNNFFSKA